eukprot:gene10463-11383_t
MPIYAALGVYYRTYNQRYAWTISPVFLSGTNPTIILMIFFVLFVIFAVILLPVLFKKAVQDYYDRQINRVLIDLKWRVLSLWTIAWLINSVIMITADSLYVYLIIHRSTKYEYLIEIALALFKLGWHDIGIFRMIHKLKNVFATSADNRSSTTISLEHANLDAITLPMLALPNNEEEMEGEKELLPLGWEEDNEASLKIRSKYFILHRKQRLTLRISYTFAVMFVFGSLFPLALIAAIAIINISMLEEYLTKCVLDRSDLNTTNPDVNHSDYVEYLEEECKHIDWNFFKVLKLIVCLTCGLLGFVLFDICGDRNGWTGGIIPLVLMIVFPFALYSFIAFSLKKRSTYRSRDGASSY